MSRNKKSTTARPGRRAAGMTPHTELVAQGLKNNPNQRVPSVVSTDLPSLEVVENLQGVEVLSDRKVQLDHKRAFWYADLAVFPGERKVQDTHVQTLFDHMRTGCFLSLNVVIAVAQLDGVWYKINGQHTAWAVTFMPEDYSMEVREMRFRVQNPDQLRALYRTFDAGLPRTETHLTQVELTADASLEGLWQVTVSKLIPALMFWAFEYKRDRARFRSPAMAAQFVRGEHLQTFRRVGEFYQSVYGEARHLRRVPPVAAMFATFDKVPTVSPDFWQPVADGIGLTSKDDPRWRLREYLNEATLSGPPAPGSRITDGESMYRVCVLCWNKWRQGQKMQTTPRTTKRRMKAT